jgi:hypothetical protein
MKKIICIRNILLFLPAIAMYVVIACSDKPELATQDNPLSNIVSGTEIGNPEAGSGNHDRTCCGSNSSHMKNPARRPMDIMHYMKLLP